jgi:hypothetical protein
MKISKYDAKKYAIGAGLMTIVCLLPKVGEWVTNTLSSVREKVSGLVTR